MFSECKSGLAKPPSPPPLSLNIAMPNSTHPTTQMRRGSWPSHSPGSPTSTASPTTPTHHLSASQATGTRERRGLMPAAPS